MSFRGRGASRAHAGPSAGRGHHGFGDGMSDDFDRVPQERRGQTIRRIVAFFGPYRRQVLIVLVAILATSLLGLVNPYLLKALTDEVIIGREYDRLNLYVGLMIAVPIISGLIGVGQSWLNNMIGQGVMRDLRAALYSHLQSMPLRFFTETRTGEIQSRLSNDVGGIQGVVTDTAASITANVAIAVSTVVAMALLDWRLTLLSLGLLPFFIILTFRVGKVRRAVSTETQQALAEMSAATEETLSVSGMLLTKTFGQQAAANQRFGAINMRLAALQIRQAMVGRWLFMIIGTIFSITPAFVYWLAGTLGASGDPTAPTAGTIVAFTTLQSRLFFPLGQLLNVQVEIQGSLALFDRIFEYLNLEPEIKDAPDAVALDRASVRGEVTFRRASFRYAGRPVPAAEDSATAGSQGTDASADGAQADRNGSSALPADAAAEARPGFALMDLEFAVRPGQLVALVGPSGSGKTTSTYLIPRLYDVSAGAVEVDGHDVRSVTLESLGQVIGFVTQETYLFHSTIRENLRYAKPDATQADLEAATRAAAIHDRIMELANGYDTTVGERGYKLSGGEKQRIAIARVLLKNPRILILDEATSALDTVSERLIQAALERVMAGRTTIAIAHRLSTILAADLILVFDRGRIVERGSHEELLGQGGLYARLYREQFVSAARGREMAAEQLAAAGSEA